MEGYAALLQYRQFILWREIPVAGSKPLKVPHSVHSASECNAHDAQHWSTYETVAATAAALGPDYGVGFVLTEADPFFLLDLDDCYHAGEWSTVAQQALAAFPGALVEVSRSGRGLHVIGSYRAMPEHKCKNSELGFELYHRWRFVALGNMGTATGSAAADCTDYLPGVVQAFFDPTVVGGWDDWREGPVAGWHGPEDDDELLRRALASRSVKSRLGGGVTFRQLFEADEGALAEAFPDTFGQGRTWDGSSADAALFTHLAFWTGKDCPRMERLARRSALYREKWDGRPDYIERTIRGACGVSRDVYRGRADERPEVPIPFDECAEAAPAPAVADVIDPRRMPVETIRELHNEDAFDAAVIMQNVFQGRLKKYRGDLYFFDNRQWGRIEDDTVRYLIMRSLGPEFKRSWSRVVSNFNTLRTLAEELPEIDAPSERAFFINGVLDGDQLLPHAPHYGNTRTLTVPYDTAAACAQWIDWLHAIFDGDSGRVALLQEAIGWTLCRSTLGIEKMLLLIGPPRAGKGVILRLLSALHGEASVPFQLAAINDDKLKSELVKAQCAIDTDCVGIPLRRREQIMGLLKVWTANEPVSVRYLYQQAPGKHTPNCKLIVSANSLPQLTDDSSAMAGRFVPIVFNHSYLDREDPGLYGRFLAELPGIAQWAVAGLRRLQARGRFELPEISRLELEEVKRQGSPLLDFFTESLEFAPGERASSSSIHKAYVLYAIENGEQPMPKKALMRRLNVVTAAMDGLDYVRYRLPDGSLTWGYEGLRVRAGAAPGNVAPFSR